MLVQRRLHFKFNSLLGSYSQPKLQIGLVNDARMVSKFVRVGLKKTPSKYPDKSNHELLWEEEV